jgi:hypothetical protein
MLYENSIQTVAIILTDLSSSKSLTNNQNKKCEKNKTFSLEAEKNKWYAMMMDYTTSKIKVIYYDDIETISGIYVLRIQVGR